MNAVERVQAAIDKLETLKAEAFPGEWEVLTSGIEGGDHWYVMAERESILSISANDGSDEDYRRPTASLIVTLHRTIDPLLSTLTRWLEYRPLAMEEPIVALADSILGGAE